MYGRPKKSAYLFKKDLSKVSSVVSDLAAVTAVAAVVVVVVQAGVSKR